MEDRWSLCSSGPKNPPPPLATDLKVDDLPPPPPPPPAPSVKMHIKSSTLDCRWVYFFQARRQLSGLVHMTLLNF